MTTIISWALLIVQILFGIAAFFIFLEFKRGWDFRNFLAAVTFGTAGLSSYSLAAWWPLVVGFGLLWVFKIMGLDPSDSFRRR